MRMSSLCSLLTAVPLAVIALAVQAAGANACDRAETLAATTPTARHDGFARRSYLDEAKLAVATRVDLVLIGDSLAQAWDVKMWQPMRVVNLGVGGDTTQNVLWRLSSTKWSKITTPKVLVMLGTNN